MTCMQRRWARRLGPHATVVGRWLLASLLTVATSNRPRPEDFSLALACPPLKLRTPPAAAVPDGIQADHEGPVSVHYMVHYMASMAARAGWR